MDVVAVQETHLGASAEVALEGYSVVRKDAKRGARGLCAFVRHGLVAVRDPRLEVEFSLEAWADAAVAEQTLEASGVAAGGGAMLEVRPA